MQTRTVTRLATGVALGLILLYRPEVWRVAGGALSPFLGICAPIAVRSMGWATLLAAPMVAAVVLRRRFWCRRLCPVGLMSEACGRVRGERSGGKSAGRKARWPAARWLALGTLVGALWGYPLFLWMDPLAVFAGFFSVGQLGGPRVAVWAVAGLPAVLLISVVWPGQWCGRLCPLGGTQDLLALAVHWWRRGTRPVVGRESRRAVLAGGAGILLGVVSGKLWAVRRRELRPPGAVEEAAFEGGCIRCGSCSRVCPTGIIQPAVAGSDGTGFLAPRLRFSGTDYCLQDCNKCGAVCPTGVIRPLELAEKNRHVIGVAEVDLTECYLTLEKECGVCVARCPRAAIVDVFDYKTYHASVVVKGEMCNGCGACVGICPPRVIRVVGDGGPARRRAT